jgi:hypothetical protein
MTDPQIPLSLWIAFGLPLAATFAWFILFFLRPRPYVPHPDELDAEEDEDHSPPSSLSESSSIPTAGSSTAAPGTGESGPNG